ncbi:hypothetical protein VST7929_02518 [Vibrio stylophorae]|uniref:DUF3135 domain-containing protein n=1 Tax=Vibrio stylophorae TaxID=659351 RepID=A0ABN8DW95_9VIBR|nr:DUF3135 domain-containing protein [Vibrio stylophorae]CAH0534574.1 hypothetical protein VST7929_02518 [Vibrio stylophorae]
MTALPPFDQLMRLAEQQPKALDALRYQLSQELIAQAPKERQPQLHAHYSHINRLIGLGKNPHHVNVLLSRELHKQVHRLQRALKGELSGANNANHHPAEVIPLARQYR